jgi:hypothetical protein
MKKFGLVFNQDKSRPLKLEGKWLVESFKFLGVTFHVSNDAPIIVQGTPRSGNILEFDKMEMVEQYKARDVELAKIGNSLEPRQHPQSLLDSWGLGELPGNLIPREIIEGKSKASPALIARIRHLASNVSLADLSGGSLSESEKNLFSKIKSGSNLNWLGIRKAGLILNRLHGGSWTPLEESADRSLSSPSRTKGRSWLELHRANESKFFTESSVAPKTVAMESGTMSELSPTQSSKALAAENKARARFLEKFPLHLRDKALSIWNSTSMATKVALNLLRNPKSVKLRKRGIQYL